MLNRSLLFLALTLQISFTTSNVNAANDLEKWNSEQGRVARSAMKEKINTTTYREMPNHVDSSYRSAENGGKVLRQLETSAEIKGSRVGTTIEALKEVDKHATAKKWAKELGKGGLRFAVGAVLIEAAMQEMLDGIGWIIDEGGKVNKKPDPNSEDNAKYSSPYAFYNSGGSDFYSYSSFDAAAQKYWDRLHNMNPTLYESIESKSVVRTFSDRNGFYTEYKFIHKSNGVGGKITGFTILRKSNPDYKPDYVVEPQPVPQSEIEQKINDYLNDPTKPQNVKDIIIEQAEKPKGKASIMWSDDPSSEQTINQDNKNTANKILNSDDPKGEGLVKDTPKISDGTEGSADTTPKPDPNPNPDPDPGTTPTPNPNPNPDTGSTTIFKWPPFCDYAAKLCDWLDWTQEKPDEEEPKEEENINNRGIFDRTFDLDFSLGGQCPPNLSWSMNNKYFNKTFEIDLGWACMFFTAIGYALLFLSNCIGIWVMYETVVRKDLKW